MNSRLLFSLPALFTLMSAFMPMAEGAGSTLPSLGLVTKSGFCPGGAWEGALWPGGRRPEGLETWGSHCSVGDEDVGYLESQEFLAPPVLNFYLAGYPGKPGLRLVLKNVQSRQETELRPRFTGDNWRFNTLPVPPEWIGKPVQLIAEDRVTTSYGWLAFSLPFLPASSLLPPIDTTVPQGGFCPDGVYKATKWPDGVRPPGIVTWGSFCKSGDADTGWWASQPVVADSDISIYVAGYPGAPGLPLMVENLQAGRQLFLQALAPPGETWRLLHFHLPDEWSGQSIRIVARDQATTPYGWLAFSEPVPMDLKSEAAGAAKTLGLLFLLVLALLLPSVAACMLAAFRGVEDLLDLTATALLVLGLTGYAAFWIYFCNRIAGAVFSYTGLLGSCAVIAYLAAAKSRRSKLRSARQMIAPGALVLLAGFFIVSLGMLYGGEDHPFTVANDRFGPPGPPALYGDNTMPKSFADGIYAGRLPHIGGGWLSSDRPPLQAGNALWTYAWIPGNRDLPYQLLSVVLQCSFLAGLWGFLTACNIDRRPMALAIGTCFLSGFTLLNGFFTWPKLFPVAFLLIVAAYLLTDRFFEVRDRTIIGAMLGAAVAFAMLGHGGSMFAIFGVAACMLLLRRYPSRRFLTSMAITAVLLYIPWTLYQKFYDPPGDRLLKWHLAGVSEPRPEASLAGLLISRYGSLKASALIQYKVSNFEALARDLPKYLEEAGIFGVALVTGSVAKRNTAASSIQQTMFYGWVPSIGLAVLGPVALLLSSWSRRRRGATFVAASRIWLLTGLTLVLWCLIMFGPAATEPRQGTYLTEILALAGAPLAFWAVRPWLAVSLTAVQILWNAILFVWLTPVASPPGAETGRVNVFLGAASLISAAAIFALLAGFAIRKSSHQGSGRSVCSELDAQFDGVDAARRR